MRLTAEQKEIVVLLIAAVDNETTEEHYARLQRLVIENEDLSLFLLQLLNQEAWLSLHGLHDLAAKDQAKLAAKIRSLLTPAETGAISQAMVEQFEEEKPIAQVPSASRPRNTAVAAFVGNVNLQTVTRWALPAMQIAVALLIGVAIGMGSIFQLSAWQHRDLDSANLPAVGPTIPSQGVSSRLIKQG